MERRYYYLIVWVSINEAGRETNNLFCVLMDLKTLDFQIGGMQCLSQRSQIMSRGEFTYFHYNSNDLAATWEANLRRS